MSGGWRVESGENQSLGVSDSIQQESPRFEVGRLCDRTHAGRGAGGHEALAGLPFFKCWPAGEFGRCCGLESRRSEAKNNWRSPLATRHSPLVLMSRCLVRIILLTVFVLPALPTRSATTPEGIEFFEQKIRPILVDRCYQCHSAKSEKLKGGLHLDSREGALKGGDTRPAVVPGQPENSLLVQAIHYENPDLQMPPKKKLTEAEISDLVYWIKMEAPWPNEVAQNTAAKTSSFNLEQRRQQHWAWKPIETERPPAVDNTNWPASPVDQFILSKLEQNNLQPAPTADKRTLIRRAYFDLIGLPPAPRDVESLLNDSSPHAFERVVDQLLSSPQFGERWARHWLDLVRYAETLGHEFDYPIFNAWRYRDYVIRAFNFDVPYNQFAIEQLAGDLLEHTRRNPSEGFNESLIGTGFFWLGQRSHSPVDVRLEEAEVVGNQIDVTAKTFLGLTVACARCHDHKFDAISTRDYYSLFGVFGSSRYAQRSIGATDPLTRKTETLSKLKEELRPLVGTVWLEQATNMAAYLAAVAEVQSTDIGGTVSNRILNVASVRQLNSSQLERWVRALGAKETAQPDHPLFVWTKLTTSDGQGEAGSLKEKIQSVISSLPKPAQAVAGSDCCDPDTFGDFSGHDFAGWSVEDEAFGKTPSPAGDFVVGDPRRPVLALLTDPAANSASVSRRLEGVLRSPTFTIQKRYAHILASGSGCRVNVRVDNFTMIREPIYGGLKQSLDSEPLSWITIDLDTWKGHRAYFEFDDLTTADPSDESDKHFSKLGYLTVSRVIFSDNSSPPSSATRSPLISADDLAQVASGVQLPASTGVSPPGPDASTPTANQLAASLAELYQENTLNAVRAWMGDCCVPDLTPTQISWLSWLNVNSLLDGGPEETPASNRLNNLLAEFRKIEDSIPERARAIAMIDGTGLDENVFIRGNQKTLGEIVPRRFLEALGGTDQTRFTQGSGRLELARSISDPENPFFARVMVNRVWLHLFGRGIVPTPDDFGALGQPPTHPELLDWLANWYRTEAGWSTKKLIRLLMTSQTYRMSSNPADKIAEKKDPQNLLFHRMPVRRLESEPIRDAILAISGQLNTEMFGPPIPVYLTEFMEGRGRPTHSGPLDGAGRRSIYQALHRNFLPPMMRAFDFPVPFSTIGRRTSSNVPAQSLILMNDPFVIGQAQAWATSVLAKHDQSAEQRIDGMYETIFSRPPTAKELTEALAFLGRQGDAYGLQPAQRSSDPALWADLCQVLMNVKEFIFLN